MMKKIIRILSILLLLTVTVRPLHAAVTNTKSIDLNGSTQYLYRADNASLSITGDIAMMGWINLDALPGASVASILSKDDRSNDAKRSYLLFINANKLSFYYHNSGTASSWANCDTAFDSGDVDNWVHFAVSVDVSAATFDFYIDASLQSDTVNATAANAIQDIGTSFLVGASLNTTAERYFNGQIDELSLWNKTLSSTEVSNNYNSGNGQVLTGSETGLVSYWRFEDDLTDSDSTNSNTLTNVNSATYSTDVPFTGETAAIPRRQSEFWF